MTFSFVADKLTLCSRMRVCVTFRVKFQHLNQSFRESQGGFFFFFIYAVAGVVFAGVVHRKDVTDTK